MSHDATMKEYIVINSTAGHLKDSITAAKKDYKKVENLKITGEINGVDFYFMRDSMLMLRALNLKEVKIARTDELLHFGSGSANHVPMMKTRFRKERWLIKIHYSSSYYPIN